jgi:hypothetical protein
MQKRTESRILAAEQAASFLLVDRSAGMIMSARVMRELRFYIIWR